MSWRLWLAPPERLEQRCTPAAGPFTVAVLPDTQFYSQSYPETFLAQTRWITENLDARRIAFVTHLGDIVQSNARGTTRNLVEWQRADAALDLLDGDLAGNPDGLVPYSVALGNHDTDVMWSKPGIATRYDEFFGASRYAARSWYVEDSGLTGNHAQLFTAGGYRFLHLTLQFEPLDSDLAWARDIMARHPGLPTILSTHSYVRPSSGGRYAVLQGQPGAADDPANAGEQVFQELVRTNPQIFLVMNGHFGGEFHQVSANAFGQPVLELAADYQGRTNGGDGWMRLLEIDTDAGEVRVQTYSPTLDRFERDADSEFTLPLEFRGRYGAALPEGHAVGVFQDGRTLGSGIYSGTVDTQLRQASPTTSFAAGSSSLLVDQASPLRTDSSQVLMRFDGIVGSNAGQVPPGATVLAARLVVNTTNPGAGGSFHRMLTTWTGSATWNSLGRGLQADGREAVTAPSAQAGVAFRTPLVPVGATEIDVTSDVRAWVAGAPNHGWAILPWGGGTDGWAFSPAEAAAVGLRPKLIVEWLPAGTAVAVFQQGAGGYSAALDTNLVQSVPFGSFAASGLLQTKPVAAGSRSQALLRFDDIFGTAPGRIPPGAEIESARLRLTLPFTAGGDGFQLHRLLQPFVATATWATSFGGNGVQPYGLEARAASELLVGPIAGGRHAFDVTASLRSWAAGAANRGWFFEQAGGGTSFASSDYAVATERPRLEVVWRMTQPQAAANKPAATGMISSTTRLRLFGSWPPLPVSKWAFVGPLPSAGDQAS